MKKEKLITFFTILLNSIFLLFAFPAVDLSFIHPRLKADGLNLVTITNGKYDKEIKFADGLDIRGGKKYTFQVDLDQELKNYYSKDQIKNLDLNQISKNSVDKFV